MIFYKTMKKKHFLAFDIGATSGRAVVGIMNETQFEMQEIHRFPNGIMELHGKYYWDIYQLYAAMKESLMRCARMGFPVDSIGIDTWGVDFGYIGKNGTILGLPRAYRDPYTEGAPEAYFTNKSREEVYRITGIQIMNFNSLYQLYSAGKEHFEPLEAAESILFIPDLLAYMLTGKQVCEYTEASTSQLIDPRTRTFEPSLLEAAGVSPELLKSLIMPGAVIGTLTDALAAETGVGRVPVVAVAGHDTASAVLAVPAENKHFAYLSSGTWSLMGVETESPIITDESYLHNFTNEGGIEGTTRFLKNITGMWLLEQCRKEWEQQGRDYSYPEIVAMAEAATPFACFVNPDDSGFANPKSMTKAINAYCEQTGQQSPETDAAYIRCIFDSLAMRYKEVLSVLQSMAPFEIHCLHVIGGGSKNRLLNQLTANAIQMPVIAGPAEATAIGNCMIQAKAAGLLNDRWEIRRQIKRFISPERFIPEEKSLWENAYEKYNQILLKK